MAYFPLSPPTKNLPFHSDADDPRSIPLLEYKADADPVHRVVVVQKAFAISKKILHIPTDPFKEWETPFNLQSAAVMVNTEIVPEHRSEPVLLEEIVPPDLPVAQVFFDIGIVVIFAALRNAVPSFQEKRKTVSSRDLRSPRCGSSFSTRVPIGRWTGGSCPLG